MTHPFDPGYLTGEQLQGLGFAALGVDVRISRDARLIGLGNIRIGNHVRIDGHTVIAAHSGFLSLGDYIHIGAGCYLACGGGIELSDFAGLSQGVRIYSVSDDYSGAALTNPTVPAEFLRVQSAPVSLGRHVIIGSGTVILPGVSIGEGSSVGALSLVARTLEPWGVYGGAPVRRIRARERRLLDLERQLRASGA